MPAAQSGGALVCDPAERDGANLRRLGRSTPGFMEADLVAHSGPTAKGSFVQTLTVTDIATGWTECAPVLVREQTLLTGVLGEIRKLLPFPLLGFDTDNDAVFMNETVRDYCQAAGIAFTRCHPYRKNDQAWVEQKNGAVVRRSVGYRRFEGLEAEAALARLYASLRLFVNYFQPSFKLAGKSREGARVKKRYHAPATPYQRLLADPRTPDTVRQEVDTVYATLDPVRLLSDIRQAQARLVEIADRPAVDVVPEASAPTLEQFLASLRTAWQQARCARRRGLRRQRSAAGVGPTVRGGHGRGARVVRRRAVADEPRAVRAIAGDAPWSVPRRPAADAAAADQGLASRAVPLNGVRRTRQRRERFRCGIGSASVRQREQSVRQNRARWGTSPSEAMRKPS
jgi:hypothetical protein